MLVPVTLGYTGCKCAGSPPSSDALLPTSIGVDEMMSTTRKDDAFSVPVLQERRPPLEISGSFWGKAALGSRIGRRTQRMEEVEQVPQEGSAQRYDAGAEGEEPDHAAKGDEVYGAFLQCVVNRFESA
jgi:hypothetical protein